MAEPRVTLAAIVGAHGISGEVCLKLFAESIESLQRHKMMWAGERQLTLMSAKTTGGAVLARFAEIGDRTAAEALRGQELWIPRSALPPLLEGEYYHTDLIGMPCFSLAGDKLGKIVAVENFGAGDILEIECLDGRRMLIPFKPNIAGFDGAKMIIDPVFLV